MKSIRIFGLGLTMFGLAFVANAEDEKRDDLLLEEVIVTAVPTGVSKMSSSLSITSLTGDQARLNVPRSTTEILRSIPGIRSESSAGESNTNISIRGIPVASGGGKFLQLHEDGLPVLEFGDIIVGNADNYISFDTTVSRIEAVKGGSAATFASNSPAGIINFVSKRGETEGGSLAVSQGLDYGSTRFDIDYGKPIGETGNWLFHVGGYYRFGEGVRDTGFEGDRGGQIKLSLQRNFDNGHVRLYVKRLDDKTSTYLPMPVLASAESIPGFNALTSSNIPAELFSTLTGDGNGGTRQSSVGDGSLVQSSVIGGDLHFELSDIISVKHRFRIAQNSGKFYGAFTASLASATAAAADPSSISTAFTDTGGDTFAYASGVGAGVALTADQLGSLNGNGLVQNIRSFDNDINSLNNYASDLSFNFEMAEGYDLTLGYYASGQEIDINWFWQTYIADVSDTPRLLDVFEGGVDGTQLTDGGTAAYGAPDWGYCCYRDTDLETSIQAYYLAVTMEFTDLISMNLSVRQDDGKGQGQYATGIANQDVDVNRDGVINNAESHSQVLSQGQLTSTRYSYDWSYLSYALGANFLLDDNNALFLNIASGGRANADRLGDGGYIVNGTAAPNSVVNKVDQFEFGYKLSSTNFDLFTTLFLVTTEDVNSEGTSGADNAARVREYSSSGLEIEFAMGWDFFDMRGGITYTNAEITASNDEELVGNKPRRQADLVYSLTPTFRWGEKSVAGISFIGTGSSYAQDANDYELPGYIYTNLFVQYYVSDEFSVGLSVNNVTDTVGLTEAEENEPVVISDAEYVRGRSIAGRTVALTLQYDF